MKFPFRSNWRDERGPVLSMKTAFAKGMGVSRSLISPEKKKRGMELEARQGGNHESWFHASFRVAWRSECR